MSSRDNGSVDVATGFVPSASSDGFPPDKKNRRQGSAVVLLATLCAITTCALSIGFQPNSNTLDFPIIIISAQRLLEGELPYADFSVLYGPLGHYVVAAGMRSLQSTGPPAKAVSVFFAMCTIFYFGVLLGVARTWLSDQRRGFFALCVYCLVTAPVVASLSWYAMLPAILTAAAALLLHIAFTVDSLWQADAAMIGLGITCAVTLHVKFNFGVYLFFGLAFVIVLGVCQQYPRRWSLYLAAAGAATVTLALSIAILHHVGIAKPYVSEMIEYLPRFKTRHFPLSHRLQVLTVQVNFALVLLAAGSMAIVGVRHAWRRGPCGAFFVASLCVPLTHYAIVRFDYHHVMPLILISPWLALFALHERSATAPLGSARVSLGDLKRSKTFSLVGWLPWISICSLGLVVLPQSAALARSNAAYWLTPHTRSPWLVERNGVLISQPEAALLDWLEAEMAPGEELFWASIPGTTESTSHGGVNMLLYVAAGQLPVTRVWYFDTPTTPYPDVQKKIIGDLERYKVVWIGMQGLLDPGAGYVPGNPPESRLLYTYVRSAYSEVARVNIAPLNRYYEIFRRREND